MGLFLQLDQPKRFGFREVWIEHAIALIPSCMAGVCGAWALLAMTAAFLTGMYPLAVLGLVPLAVFGALLFFLPAACICNPYVKRIVKRLPQEEGLTGLLHVCQVSFCPRVHGGVRGFLEDADDVGRLCISDEAISFSGDHIRFSLPFDCIRSVSHANCGGRGLWLAGRRIKITTDVLAGYESIEVLERESNTLISSQRISRDIIQALIHRVEDGATVGGNSAREGRKTKAIYLVAAVALVGILGLVALRHANSQWHKSIYMFQAYVCQMGHEGCIRPPPGYTGKWVTWWWNGQKWMEYNLRDGTVDGAYVTWHPNGQKSFEGTYRGGEPVGLDTSWYDNGQKLVEKTWQHGKVNGLLTVWNRQGSIVRIDRFADGNLVEHIQENPKE